MASNSKKKKNKTPDPAKMKPETVEKVVAKELWKDERTHKIIGAFFFIDRISFIRCIHILFIYVAGRSVKSLE